MKFTPPPFPSNPSPEQWAWWRQCFIDGLAINEIVDDKHKLTFLRTHAGSELFSLLVDTVDFKAALKILDAQFKRPTRVLYARHQLLTGEGRRALRRRAPHDSETALDDRERFFGALRIAA